MRRRWALLALVAAAVLQAFQAGAQSLAVGGFAAAPADPAAFTRRPAPVSRLDYLQAIRFIDDGMKYADPRSAFFVSPAGEMCFVVRPSHPLSIYADQYRTWCLYPRAVDRVEALPSGGDGISIIRLWCRYADPQCARRLFPPAIAGGRSWAANDIVVPTVAYRAQRARLEYLIFIMGGGVAPAAPVRLIPPAG